ncbi:hypothetical protein DID80_05135 [Candidatus Marinamargulisbacteria bacterium SCGC AAA071-K20]|nr:hypothetical protein DID80_05135 [Candidatus Marinamargulisbacteria bacterium SCGC AAA071-K20]
MSGPFSFTCLAGIFQGKAGEPSSSRSTQKTEQSALNHDQRHRHAQEILASTRKSIQSINISEGSPEDLRNGVNKMNKSLDLLADAQRAAFSNNSVTADKLLEGVIRCGNTIKEAAEKVKSNPILGDSFIGVNEREIETQILHVQFLQLYLTKVSKTFFPPKRQEHPQMDNISRHTSVRGLPRSPSEPGELSIEKAEQLLRDDLKSRPSSLSLDQWVGIAKQLPSLTEETIDTVLTVMAKNPQVLNTEDARPFKEMMLKQANSKNKLVDTQRERIRSTLLSVNSLPKVVRNDFPEYLNWCKIAGRTKDFRA